MKRRGSVRLRHTIVTRPISSLQRAWLWIISQCKCCGDYIEANSSPASDGRESRKLDNVRIRSSREKLRSIQNNVFFAIETIRWAIFSPFLWLLGMEKHPRPQKGHLFHRLEQDQSGFALGLHMSRREMFLLKDGEQEDIFHSPLPEYIFANDAQQSDTSKFGATHTNSHHTDCFNSSVDADLESDEHVLDFTNDCLDATCPLSIVTKQPHQTLNIIDSSSSDTANEHFTDVEEYFE
eukprot:CFRG7863T1